MCTFLRKHAKNIIDFEIKKDLKSHEDAKVCYICGRKILKTFAKDINYRKVRDHCHYTGKYTGTAHSICNLKLNVPDKISVVFHRDLTNDYHFIIKELANGFEGQFKCLWKNKKIPKFFRSNKKRNHRNN